MMRPLNGRVHSLQPIWLRLHSEDAPGKFVVNLHNFAIDVNSGKFDIFEGPFPAFFPANA